MRSLGTLRAEASERSLHETSNSYMQYNEFHVYNSMSPMRLVENQFAAMNPATLRCPALRTTKRPTTAQVHVRYTHRNHAAMFLATSLMSLLHWRYCISRVSTRTVPIVYTTLRSPPPPLHTLLVPSTSSSAPAARGHRIHGEMCSGHM